MRVRAGLWFFSMVVFAVLIAAPASATTFCVPGYHAACPNSGGNIAQANLETAMQTSGDDTIPDRIVIAAAPVTNPNPYELLSGDNDDLEIIGAGPSATAITTTGTGNEFVMNLNGARKVTLRDLTIRAPASFEDNLGGAVQAQKDIFENVDFESRNIRSDGAVSMIGGSVFKDGRVYGSMGGSIDTAFSGNGAETGTLTVERTEIESPSWGISSDDPEVTIFARRVKITDPLAYGVRITDGAFLVFENGIIEADTGIPVIAESTDAGTVIATVRHTTIIGSGIASGDTAIRSIVDDSVGNGPTNLVVSDSIIAGYEDALTCEAPEAANVGNALLTVRYSYFFHSAIVNGDCTLSNPNTIDAFDPKVGAPQFVGPSDYHLPLGSPAIDSGDPATVSLPTEDFDGAPRPVDGNADGKARRDMGAFEYQPPTPLPSDPNGKTSSNPTAPTAQTDISRLTLALARKRIGVKEKLRILVQNLEPTSATGTLAVETTRLFGPRGKRRPVKMRPVPLQIDGGATKIVRLTLTKRLISLLEMEGKLRLRLTAKVKNPSGSDVSFSVIVVSKLKPSRTIKQS